MPPSWHDIVKDRKTRVDPKTLQLLLFYDAFLADKKVPYSSHREVMNSTRNLGNGNGGAYDRITKHRGYKHIDEYCRKHATPGNHRKFFQNRVFKIINGILNDRGNRGGDDDDVESLDEDDDVSVASNDVSNALDLSFIHSIVENDDDDVSVASDGLQFGGAPDSGDEGMIANKEMLALRKQNENLKKKNSDLVQGILRDKHTLDEDSREDELIQLREERSMLQDNLEVAQDRVIELEMENENLEMENNDLRGDLEDTENDLIQLRRDHSVLGDEFDKLAERKDTKSGRLPTTSRKSWPFHSFSTAHL